jgi:hypothetical protein
VRLFFSITLSHFGPRSDQSLNSSVFFQVTSYHWPICILQHGSHVSQSCLVRPQQTTETASWQQSRNISAETLVCRRISLSLRRDAVQVCLQRLWTLTSARRVLRHFGTLFRRGQAGRRSTQMGFTENVVELMSEQKSRVCEQLYTSHVGVFCMIQRLLERGCHFLAAMPDRAVGRM